MAIAYNVGAVAGKNYEAPASSSTTTAITTTGGSGSLFLAFVYHEQTGEGFTSITDSKTNSWAQVGSTLSNGNHYTRIYSCHGGTGGSNHTFTATYTATGAIGIAVVELTGCATSSAVDKVAQVFDNTEPFNSGSTATTAQNNEMLVGYFRGDSTANETFAVDSSSTPTSGWTKRLEFTQAGETVRELPTLVATVGVTSTGAYNFACTAVSAEGHAIIVTVKEGETVTNTNYSPSNGSVSVSGQVLLINPQLIAPTADTAIGTWTASSGDTLYQMVDESAADSADYIQSGANPSSDTITMKLATVTDPGTDNGFHLQFQAQSVTSSGTLAVSLRQGNSPGTEIASWSVTPMVGSWVFFDKEITSTQAGNITDFSDLYVRLVAS